MLRLSCSALALLTACPAATSPVASEAPAEPPAKPTIRCFEITDDRGGPECNGFTRIRVKGCFVEGGVDLDYELDVDECTPEDIAHYESEGLDPPELDGHGDLEWHGRLGAAWADDLERMLLRYLETTVAGPSDFEVTFEDGSVSSIGPLEMNLLAPSMWEFEDIAKQAAGLGPAPILVIARGLGEERFELRRRPADHVADLIWSDGDRSGRCEIDRHTVHKVLVLLSYSAFVFESSCPDGPGYFVFSKGDLERCSRARRVSEPSFPRAIDPRMGEVHAPIAATLELLRATAKSCGE